MRFAANAWTLGTIVPKTVDTADYERLTEAALKEAADSSSEAQRKDLLDHAATLAALGEKKRGYALGNKQGE